MELIAVVLKSPTGQQRFEDAKALLNYGFSTYALLHTRAGGALPPSRWCWGRRRRCSPASTRRKRWLLVQKSQAGVCPQSITLAEQVEAPVSAGTGTGDSDADGCRRRDGAVHPHPGGAERGAAYLAVPMLRRMLSAAFFAG